MDELTGLSGGGRKRSMIQNSISAGQSSSPVLTNFPLISALVAFALAQFIKVFTSWYKEKRWDLKQLVGSGGMPSSHSATVTALAAGIGFHDGFGGSLFAAALVLACVVRSLPLMSFLKFFSITVLFQHLLYQP